MPAILPQSANAGSWLTRDLHLPVALPLWRDSKARNSRRRGPRSRHQQRDQRRNHPRPPRRRRSRRHPRRLRVDHEGQRRPDPSARDRSGQPHPFPGRLVHRHRPRQPHAGSEAARDRRPLAATVERLDADHDRRRRHRVLGDEARRESRAADIRVVHVPKTIDNDLDLPSARRHVRLPDRAALRRRDRQEPDGRREDHVALVLRDRDGPQGRPPRARHGQGGRRDADAHPGGIRRAARSRSRPSSTRSSAPSSSV